MTEKYKVLCERSKKYFARKKRTAEAIANCYAVDKGDRLKKQANLRH